MPGAAHHAMRLASGFANRLLDFIHQKRIHRHRLLAQQDLRASGIIRAVWQFRSACLTEIFNRAIRDFIRSVTNIQSQPSLAGDDVGGSGLGIYLPHGGHQSRDLEGLALDHGDPLRSAGNCIVAKMHGRRTGMVGLANENELQPALAGNRVDRRQRPAQRLKNRTLFDVKFEVAQNIIS